MNSKYVIAGSTLALAFAAAPFAYAGTDISGEHRFDLGSKINLGSIIRAFDDEKEGDAKASVKVHASSTVSVRGTVTAVNGTTILLQGKDAASYTVNAANAEVEDGTIADIKIGDSVKVKGKTEGSVIVATRIDDKHIDRREISQRLENLRAGIVTSVSNGVLTITRLGTGTSSTISTNASTSVKVRGDATTTDAIAAGDIVIAVGANGNASGNPDGITATVIHIVNNGFGWLKHFLFR